ncbi:BON domain-containing protein [Amycolatopsis anabasis]|uniref:BON domain-containing protein n=1 Tax=Amycolatopsis anabasis TaxID=1840409 RepID=UPI00131DDC65|nr:BON domain-containing protein [Amycolatopsis anabasis]
MSAREQDNPPQYRAADLSRILAEDARTAELGIRVDVRGGHVHLSGEVATVQRREELERVLAEHAPELRIHNDVRVSAAGEPDGREELR